MNRTRSFLLALLFISGFNGCMTALLHDTTRPKIEKVLAASVRGDGKIELLARYSDGRVYHLAVTYDVQEIDEEWPVFLILYEYNAFADVELLDKHTEKLPPSGRKVHIRPWTKYDYELTEYTANDALIVLFPPLEIHDTRVTPFRYRDPPVKSPYYRIRPRIVVIPPDVPVVWTDQYPLCVLLATPFTLALDIVTAPLWAVLIGVSGGPG